MNLAEKIRDVPDFPQPGIVFKDIMPLLADPATLRETVGATYALEYGQNTLELHPEAVSKGDRILIHDDVLATGGTVEAIAGLVESLGGEVVGVAFIIELTFLGGRQRLKNYDFHALIAY